MPYKFQLTRSRGAWRHFSRLCIRKQVFQLTRSRGAWRSGVILNRYVYRISTHTLTWSVTLPCRTHSSVTAISTHTLTWSVTPILFTARQRGRFQLTRSRGAWRDETWNQKINFRFQLTRSRGAWQQASEDVVAQREISTHTLTWSVTMPLYSKGISGGFQLTRSRGAWPSLKRCRQDALSFQLTRSRGAWQRYSVLSGRFQKFQLTRSRGAWQVEILDHNRCFDFNSHAHVERDQVQKKPTAQRPQISTHTLTWSVT